MNRGDKGRLTSRAISLFPSETLFDRLARAVCRAECLPRKELFETWEMARRVRRRFRGGRIVDLAAGHGLLAYVMLLLDDSSPSALAIDLYKPKSATRLAEVLEAEWPRLANRVTFAETSFDEPQSFQENDLLVSAHACGVLTDRVLDLAIAARARVAVLPCCHDLKDAQLCGLDGWVDGPLAMDLVRAMRLERANYRVHTQKIPEEITPKNRLLLGAPNTTGDTR
jgi:hypothetical protein